MTATVHPIGDRRRPRRHHVGGCSFVDETYLEVAGRWRYVYRAVGGHVPVIDVYCSTRRDTTAARRFFTTMLADHGRPEEVTTDLAATLLRVVDELLVDVVDATGNTPTTGSGATTAASRPECGRCAASTRDRSAPVVIEGHAFIQNLRRGHDELGVHARTRHLRIAAAFDELATVI